MKTSNPSPLAIGAAGQLAGRRCTVTGRAVYSVELDGTRYFWNEYYLADDAGGHRTLVFEEADEGWTWKLFARLRPAQPMTAIEAASRRAGDTVPFDDKVLRVTLVAQSRAELVEGELPVAVPPGEVADYFNATVGDQMLVVSWVGAKVEYYLGQSIAAGRVEEAFQLPRGFTRSKSRGSDWFSSLDESGLGITGMVLGALVVIGIACSLATPGAMPPDPPPVMAAPPAFLTVGRQGRLDGHLYTVVGQALVEIATLRGRFDRHEYDLVDDRGARARLIDCFVPPAREWRILSPVMEKNLVPLVAAQLREGQSHVLAGKVCRVETLFRSQALPAPGPADTRRPAETEYGFLATAGGSHLMVSWTEEQLTLELARPATPAEIAAAFGVAP